MTYAFHISREARERFRVDDELFTLTGNVVLPDFAAGRRLAQRINATIDPTREPDRVVHPGELNAMGLLDEVLHALVATYREQVNPAAMSTALSALAERVGPAVLEHVLEAFVERFPTAEAMRNGTPAAQYLAGSTDDIPNREIALEELLMLWLANANPALTPFKQLFDDAPLTAEAPYGEVVAALIAHFGTQPPFGPDGQTLIEMLRAPSVAVPDSIAGQLRFVRERWTVAIERFGDSLVINLDVLAEEEQGIWRRFHPTPTGGRGGAGDRADRGGHGADGGGEDVAQRAGKAWLTESGWYGTGAGEAEPEQFSMDLEWMPRLVLIAKSAFVWLDQLSKKYGRPIGHLDEIPDEELDRLARWGFTGIWFIGLWQRSLASETIKQLRGNSDAVASAYSLDDYRIADDLGGEEAFERLKARAAARGLRIGSDMVPNHMGIDSSWVMEHPDWFMSLPEPPYPVYTFTGPDLSNDARVAIQIEDHYFDNTDAAVVFKRLDRVTGETTYIYHGNDGTSMPWNDTAQLDYLKPEVREAVIQAILGVARRSPVIRFDAAMTLAKRHIERLWYPEPGQGGGIPSRAEYAMPKAEFERRMPVEFWREVVDRVAAEVPDTLLLAEAFWLMEGYFVRTLGMHRVYNSAFMHMMRDEQNANYRTVMKNTIEFDPEVLKRYVNFMNNPDERTAVDQFGKGDKYFGVATVMATLPGLPMFGHGQIEGFTEKYGMEYQRAYWDEQPDPGLVERHEREIAPLLHRRYLFADVDDFLLFDFVREDGSVDEDVYAYTNRGGGESSLIVYNNRYGPTSGRIRTSAEYSARIDDGSREVTRRSVAEGLGLHAADGWYVALRDSRSGLESLRSSREIRELGLRLDLDPYDCRVYLGIREVQETQGRPWSRLAADLGGRGVPSLDDALRDMLLRPMQNPLRRLLEPDRLRRVAAAANGHGPEELRDDIAAVIGATRELLGETPRPEDAVAADALATEMAHGLAVVEAAPLPDQAELLAPVVRVPALDEPGAQASSASALEIRAVGPPPPPHALAGAWLLFHRLPGAVGRSDDGDRAREWIDQWRLAAVVAEAFRGAGLPEADSWRSVEAVKALLTLPAWDLDRPLPDRAARIIEAWLADESVARFLQVNVHRDVRWFNKEAFEALAIWAAVIETIRNAGPDVSDEPPSVAAEPAPADGEPALDDGEPALDDGEPALDDGEPAEADAVPTRAGAGASPVVVGPPVSDEPPASDEPTDNRPKPSPRALVLRETVDALVEAAARSGYRLDALSRPFAPASS